MFFLEAVSRASGSPLDYQTLDLRNLERTARILPSACARKEAAEPGILSTPDSQQGRSAGATRSTEELIGAVVAAPRGLQTISLIDQISDTVSRVCDAAHLCSSTHPDARFVAAANQSYLRLMTYVTVRG